MRNKRCDVCGEADLECNGPIIQGDTRNVVNCDCPVCGNQYLFTVIDDEI